MKKHLALIACAVVLGGLAKADDKGTEFKFGGETRQQFNSSQATNLGALNSASATTAWLARNQFHVNAISSDKLQAYFDFIHTAIWGGAGSVPATNQPLTQNSGGTSANNPTATSATGSTSVQNALQIQEAWMWWKMSDMISARIGRQSLNYGDGLVFSKNEWLNNPFNVDGGMFRLSWDFLDLDVGGGVLGDAGIVTTVGSTTDTENVFYGFYASFKAMPDVLKTVEVFAIQDNQDAGGPASIFLPSVQQAVVVGATPQAGGAFGLTAAGVHLKGGWSLLDYRLDGVYETGKQKGGLGGASLTSAQDVTYGANMEDVELGVNFPEFMKARVYAAYHRDTGDDSTDRTQQHQYQPLFYDRHNYGGAMIDTVGFGNLTDIRLGATVAPSDESTYGIDAHLLSRTATAQIGTGIYSPTNWLTAAEGNMYGNGGAAATAQNTYGNGTNVQGTSSDLGSQYTLWAKHDYGHGLTAYAQLSYYALGAYFKPTGVTTTNPMQLVAQVKYAF